MTELELRQNIVSTIKGWLGANKGSEKHLEILSIYNNYTPLARGYKVQVKDAYCATTVSADWIKNKIAEYTGTECSVNNLIKIAKEKGYWVERDDYMPTIGDAICYDWDDGTNYATTDNKNQAEHIGIVTKVYPTQKRFEVTEGNISGGYVGVRYMDVNGRYIRGFICPDYAYIAAELTKKETPVVPEPVVPTPTPVPTPSTPEEPTFGLTPDQFADLMYNYRSQLQDNDSSEWSKKAREWAISTGLVNGGGTLPNGEVNYMWQDFMTREQLITVLYRWAVILGKA